MEYFALVYCDYEGLCLLELGNAEFIKNKYNEYKSKIIELKEKYKKELDLCDLPDEYYLDPFSDYDNPNRLCIQGYNDDNKIECACKKFDIYNSEPIFY